MPSVDAAHSILQICEPTEKQLQSQHSATAVVVEKFLGQFEYFIADDEAYCHCLPSAPRDHLILRLLWFFIDVQHYCILQLHTNYLVKVACGHDLEWPQMLTAGCSGTDDNSKQALLRCIPGVSCFRRNALSSFWLFSVVNAVGCSTDRMGRAIAYRLVVALSFSVFGDVVTLTGGAAADCFCSCWVSPWHIEAVDVKIKPFSINALLCFVYHTDTEKLLDDSRRASADVWVNGKCIFIVSLTLVSHIVT